jgi:hypothetical protein
MKSRGKLCIFPATILYLGAGHAFADSSALSFSPAWGTIAPGQTATITLNLSADQAFSGLSLFLQASAPNAFEVISQAPLNGSLTDPSFTGSFPYVLPAPGNSLDLGYTATSNVLPAATDSVETLTIKTLPGVGYGQYSIFSTYGAAGSDLTYLTGNSSNPVADFTLNQSQSAVYTVTVPEPATLGIAVLGAGVLLTRRPRRSAARNRRA